MDREYKTDLYYAKYKPGSSLTPFYEDTQIGDVQDRYGIKYAIMKSFKDGRNADVEPRPLTEEHVKAFLKNELEDIALDSSALEQCIVVALIDNVNGDVGDFVASGGVAPRKKDNMLGWLKGRQYALYVLKHDGDAKNGVKVQHITHLRSKAMEERIVKVEKHIVEFVTSSMLVEELPYSRLLLLPKSTLKIFPQHPSTKDTMCTKLQPTTLAAEAERAAGDDGASGVGIKPAPELFTQAATRPRRSVSSAAAAAAAVSAAAETLMVEESEALEKVAGYQKKMVRVGQGLASEYDVQMYADVNGNVLQLGTFGIDAECMHRWFGVLSLGLPNPLDFETMTKYGGAPNTFPTSMIKNQGPTWLIRMWGPPAGTPISSKLEAGVLLSKEALEGLTQVDSEFLTKRGPLHFALWKGVCECSAGYMQPPSLKCGDIVAVKHAKAVSRHQYGVVLALGQLTNDDAQFSATARGSWLPGLNAILVCPVKEDGIVKVEKSEIVILHRRGVRKVDISDTDLLRFFQTGNRANDGEAHYNRWLQATNTLNAVHDWLKDPVLTDETMYKPQSGGNALFIFRPPEEEIDATAAKTPATKRLPPSKAASARGGAPKRAKAAKEAAPAEPAGAQGRRTVVHHSTDPAILDGGADDDDAHLFNVGGGGGGGGGGDDGGDGGGGGGGGNNAARGGTISPLTALMKAAGDNLYNAANASGSGAQIQVNTTQIADAIAARLSGAAQATTDSAQKAARQAAASSEHLHNAVRELRDARQTEAVLAMERQLEAERSANVTHSSNMMEAMKMLNSAHEQARRRFLFSCALGGAHVSPPVCARARARRRTNASGRQR